MSQLRVLCLRECKSVSASAFAEQNAFASLQSLDMYRCFAFSLEGAGCTIVLTPSQWTHPSVSFNTIAWLNVFVQWLTNNVVQVAWLWRSFHHWSV